MPNKEEYFIRKLHIDVLDTSLKLHQKFEGDVGCVVWDASIVLAKYLEELFKKDRECFRNFNVIELGAGVGCVGLTAACLGANVLLTDLPDIVPLLQKNAETNRVEWEKNMGKVETAPLPWGGVAEFKQTPDLILLADCVYYRESIDKLLKTLRNLSGNSTKILMTQELRDSPKQQECWNHFLKSANKYFKTHVVPLEEQNEEYRSEDIVLIEYLPL